MKTDILIFCALVLSATGKSQVPSGKGITSGKITYQETAKLEIKIEGDDAHFADALPKEHVTAKVLYFSPDYSLYMPDDTKKEEDEMTQQSGTMRIRMITGGEKDKIFCDFKKKSKTEQKEFMTRMFLIEGDLIPAEWKLTGNFRTVLGYNCQEALNADTARNVKAWFTTEIPVSGGPAAFGGLPGFILQVDINNGKQIIIATAIDPSLTDQGIITRPKEGKKVTSEEFKKIVAEKRKEMGEENGEGMNHVIIRYKN